MLKIYVAYDSGLDAFERECIRDAFVRYQHKFPRRQIILYGNRAWARGSYGSADWYVNNARRLNRDNGYGRQIDVCNLIDLLEQEPWQQSEPHIDVFFTSYDLSAQGLNFCFGMARPSARVAVQSVARYRNLSQSNRRLAIESVIWHELGHIFDVANSSRSNTEEKLGSHCTNPGCMMRQGLNVAEWIKNAREAIFDYGRFYCPQCMADMAKVRL